MNRADTARRLTVHVATGLFDLLGAAITTGAILAAIILLTP